MKKVNIFSVILLFCIFAIGCNIKFDYPTPQSYSNNQSQNAEESELLTNQPAERNIIMETKVLTPTLLDIFPTQTTTQAPQSTPFSTISPEDRSKYTIRLPLLNNVCNPPCWMNIIPGETTFNHVDDFLRSISFEHTYDNFEPNAHYYLEDPVSRQKVEIVVKFEADIIK